MTRPRQLTWLHLLPADSTFELVGQDAPAWLREPLEARQSTSRQPTLVAYETTSLDIADVKSARSVVGVNCRGLADAQLRAGGFEQIERYAVLPNWENPRWFIPVGKPCVSSAGFNLYTPAKTSARLKRFAARTAVYSRIPFWYRDQLLIARREPSPLESMIGRLFPGQPIHLALSAGAPDGALNRKASAAVIDHRGNLLAYLKLAASELATSLLRREADVLRALAGTQISQVVPRLLAAEDVEGTFVVAQAPLPGGPAGTALTPMHRRLLDAFTQGSPTNPAETELARALPGRIASLGRAQSYLTSALEAALTVLADQRVRRGVVHGDFAPWNFRLHNGRISAFDWEYGRLDGPAGLDEIHYRLQVGYLLNGWTVETALKALCDSDVLDHYLSRPHKAARNALVGLYLVDMLARLYSEGYDLTNDMMSWKGQLLSRLELPSPRRQPVREAVPA